MRGSSDSTTNHSSKVVMPFHAQEIRSAVRHLQQRDPTMKAVIRRVGPFTLRTQSDRFPLLVRSIISQQISVAAAKSIMCRLEQAVAPEKISPQSLQPFDAAAFRPLGISAPKARYLIDLRDRALAGNLPLEKIGRVDDEAVIDMLTEVHGIGRWTAQMFLIFGLGRMNVLPHADLGIQTALRHHYKLRSNPAPRKMDQLAAPWQPYCSVACWYLWQSLHIEKPDPK